LPQFTPRLIWEFSSSTALSLFFAFILGGIALYGNSRLQLRAVEDNSESWMKTAFSGFKIPLELAWLTFRVSLVYTFWMVLAFIPAVAVGALFFTAVPTPQTPAELSMSVAVVTLASVIFIAIYCIPFYKYRYLFRIKADHPDWSAGECMRHCREIVYRSKWRIFVHDCSYWRILLGALLPLLVIMAVVLLATAILGVGPRAPLRIPRQLQSARRSAWWQCSPPISRCWSSAQFQSTTSVSDRPFSTARFRGLRQTNSNTQNK
jgi:hypothetical protein